MIKEVTPYNFDEVLFEYFEGTLNESEKQMFLEFVGKNPSYQKDLDLWEQSFAADDNIEVPEGLENSFLRKEGFWESKKGKITGAAGAVGAVAVISAAVILNNQDEKTDAVPVNSNNNQGTSPRIEVIDPSTISDPVTSPSVAPFQNSSPAIPHSSSSISSDKKKVPTPNLILNESYNSAVPTNTEQPIKPDSIPTSSDVHIVDQNITSQPKEAAEKVKTIEGPNDKNGKLQKESNPKPLGKPKNIIEMRQNLEEN